MTTLTPVVGSGLRMPDDRGGYGVPVPGVGRMIPHCSHGYQVW